MTSSKIENINMVAHKKGRLEEEAEMLFFYDPKQKVNWVKAFSNVY